MTGSPIQLSRDTVKAIAASLRFGDVVSAVTWNTSNNVIMSGHHVVGPNDPTIMSMANGLSADGGTDLHGGLVAGYNLVSRVH